MSVQQYQLHNIVEIMDVKDLEKLLVGNKLRFAVIAITMDTTDRGLKIYIRKCCIKSISDLTYILKQVNYEIQSNPNKR